MDSTFLVILNFITFTNPHFNKILTEAREVWREHKDCFGQFFIRTDEVSMAIAFDFKFLDKFGDIHAVTPG
jgi:hypothetical protein